MRFKDIYITEDKKYNLFPLSSVNKIKLLKVYSKRAVLRKEKELHSRVPQSEEELEDLYNYAKGKE
jgi:hypothetical protein